jgi:hypothetical protein
MTTYPSRELIALYMAERQREALQYRMAELARGCCRDTVSRLRRLFDRVAMLARSVR